MPAKLNSNIVKTAEHVAIYHYHKREHKAVLRQVVPPCIVHSGGCPFILLQQFRKTQAACNQDEDSGRKTKDSCTA